MADDPAATTSATAPDASDASAAVDPSLGVPTAPAFRRRERLRRQRGRSYTHLCQSYPGRVAFVESMPAADAASWLACAVEISTDTREATDGGFARVRTATIYIAHSLLPGDLGFLEQRPSIWVQQDGLQPERFRITEQHTQTDHWRLFRCAQWTS